MVQRVHKYADGGKVVRDHLADPLPRAPSRASPGLGGAIKDLIGSVVGSTGVGAAVDANKRKSRTDQAVDAAS